MRLDEAGQATTIAELVARFAGRPWLYELAELAGQEQLAADTAGSVRLYPRGLTTDEPVETGDGPYVVVVDGDLVATVHVDVDTDDYVQARVIVTGSLRAGSLSYANGARVVVEGAAHIALVCVGRYGDRNAVLDVGGELSMPLLALDPQTAAYARAGIRGVIYADVGFWAELEPDILATEEDGRFFPVELLDRWGNLDLDRVVAAAREGAPLLMPGVAESFPARSRLRPTG